MAFTAKGLATRQRIVEGAAEALRGDESGTITLDDVLAITSTSKGQLFHYFPGGKDDLLLAVMSHESERVLDDQQPHLGDLSNWRSWERWRDVVVARYRAQGARCPLNALSRQLGRAPGVDAIVLDLLRRWQGMLADGIRSLQAAGLVRAEVSADRTAAALVAGIQGGVGAMWVTGDTDHLESAIEVVFSYLRGPAEHP
ncbi:TetR/AcrR family transcriptional regulator [Planctomonas sp. JC2975]|uniref:TetR/AcrR family transcriptional regulator n=1 Tax=Planctomonas sp. JC2975 TaxID=2729626 RepID=UPI001475277C|nr:TetR/AcrR family transcriptional regulator [Planctomonas sp. JC2975]NNC10301.1 TetR/AcrR family transcriptional regulator [Planctomonas sp. JC2975]